MKPHPFIALLFLAALLATLPGCEAIGWVAGRGTEKARYTLPKNQRVLVLVDVRPGISAPPGFTTTLAEQIGGHLFRYKAVDALVGQDRIIELQQDQAKYRQMAVGDIADAVNADVVVVVNVVALDVSTTIDQTTTEGALQVIVKVVDAHAGPGRERLWPAGTAGEVVEAEAQATYASERDKAQTYKDMADLLTIRVGRLFHEWDKDDKAINK